MTTVTTEQPPLLVYAACAVDQAVEEWNSEGIHRACILGTRALIETLAYFGVTGKPLSVDLLAANAPAINGMREGVPQSAWPDNWWTIGVDGTDGKRGEPGGYDGHLVVIADGWLVDPTARQFDRPDKGIMIPAPLVGEYHPEHKAVAYEADEGSVIVYRPSKRRDWHRAPAWRLRSRYGPVAARAISLTRDSLADA